MVVESSIGSGLHTYALVRVRSDPRQAKLGSSLDRVDLG